jgi:hypothetical protein
MGWSLQNEKKNVSTESQINYSTESTCTLHIQLILSRAMSVSLFPWKPKEKNQSLLLMKPPEAGSNKQQCFCW